MASHVEKALKNGYITHDEVKNVMGCLIHDIDSVLNTTPRGCIRRDLLIDRIDAARAKLLQLCLSNLEKGEKNG
jgi:hypothetical protein